MNVRRGMDDSSPDLANERPPERDDNHDESAANSIEKEHDALDAVTGPGVADSLTGTTIGNYLVGERLGGGAMAAVYRAHDQNLNQSVAIKVVLPGADAIMQARFRREARLVSTLIHPHIVRTLQVGRSGGIIYIAMELVVGATLSELLEQHGALPVADTARILAPVAEALDFAHAKGVVHRDVKPSNILLQRAPQDAANSITTSLLPYPVIPLLSDFGIARALDAPELTYAGRTIGTPAFMAPEQCAGSADIDGRADIYALGAVLYRCLVGRAPFSGTTTQILHAHVYDPLLIPDEVADALPEPVVRLMARALMKEPSQRFQQIGVMGQELRSIADLRDVDGKDAAPEEVDPTMTMASLPVAISRTSSNSRVLVPAGPSATANAYTRANPLKPTVRAPVASVTSSRTIPLSPPPIAPKPSRRGRWGMMALVGAFAVLVILAVGMFVNSVWLGGGDENPQAENATPTVVSVAAGGTTPPEVSVTVAAPARAVTTTVATATDVTPEQNSRPTEEPTRSGTTPTPQSPLALVEPTWKLALESFDAKDWEQTIIQLNLVQRSVDATDLPDEDTIDLLLMRDMLVTSNIGMATESAASGDWDEAIGYAEKAIELVPRIALFTEMVADFESLIELQNKTDAAAVEQRKELLANISELNAAYADRLVLEGKLCFAEIHVDYAIRISVSEELQDRQVELARQCLDQNAEDEIVELGGNILYSSGGGGDSYNIWRMPIVDNGTTRLPSTLILSNASQPSVSPNGDVLAYHSREGGNDGLYGVRISNAIPYGSGIRYSPSPEDSHESPSSWDYTGSRLAYATAFVNQPSHIWITSADDNTSAQDLGFGKDPAWRPGDDLIVYNGPDAAGQNPGLRVMRANNDVSARYALSDNGNDQRPTWTSDGQYVVFMSRDRSGGNSWEVYRLEFETGAFLLLTDGDPKQDGLPAISPDDKWVVFMSDRDGQWKLYYVSIDGGEVHFLSEISGQPIWWLEHSIQWVR